MTRTGCYLAATGRRPGARQRAALGAGPQAQLRNAETGRPLATPMRQFAQLYDAIDRTTSTNANVAAMAREPVQLWSRGEELITHRFRRSPPQRHACRAGRSENPHRTPSTSPTESRSSGIRHSASNASAAVRVGALHIASGALGKVLALMASDIARIQGSGLQTARHVTTAPFIVARSVDRLSIFSVYCRASETFTPRKIAIARARRLHEEC